jgi:hypothetical protein
MIEQRLRRGRSRRGTAHPQIGMGRLSNPPCFGRNRSRDVLWLIRAPRRIVRDVSAKAIQRLPVANNVLVIATLPPDWRRLLRQVGFETRPYINLDPSTTLGPVCCFAYDSSWPLAAGALDRVITAGIGRATNDPPWPQGLLCRMAVLSVLLRLRMISAEALRPGDNSLAAERIRGAVISHRDWIAADSARARLQIWQIRHAFTSDCYFLVSARIRRPPSMMK